jgi:hypothetical protein
MKINTKEVSLIIKRLKRLYYDHYLNGSGDICMISQDLITFEDAEWLTAHNISYCPWSPYCDKVVDEIGTQWNYKRILTPHDFGADTWPQLWLTQGEIDNPCKPIEYNYDTLIPQGAP